MVFLPLSSLRVKESPNASLSTRLSGTNLLSHMLQETASPDAKQFWENTYRNESLRTINPDRYRENSDAVTTAFLQRIGEPKGLRVLDLGCGAGELSVYLARLGAQVTALDLSPEAIKKTRKLARTNGVSDRIDERILDALALDELNQSFDLVVGQFILHHIEPFDPFPEQLRNTLTEGGPAFSLKTTLPTRCS